MSEIKLKVYNLQGIEKDPIVLNTEVFGLEPNQKVLHDVLVAELAAMRQGSASTKSRGEVSGGGKKPFRQKGTGRARQGSSRAPHMVGGGVVHGPKPRNFEKKVNKKVKKLALRSALTMKINSGDVIILDDYQLEAPKTKTFVEFTEKVNILNDKKLFILEDTIDTLNLYYSARNIKDTFVLDPYVLFVHSLLKYDKVVITKEALSIIEEVLA